MAMNRRKHDLDKSVLNYFKRMKSYKGRFGIELELESRKSVDLKWGYDSNTNFVLHEEGSLRHQGIELVSRNAPTWGDISSHIAALKEFLDLNPTFKETYRAGLHVHINVQDWTMREVLNFQMVWSLLENTIITLKEPSRKGSLFAVKAIDSQRLYQDLKNEFEGRGKEYLFYLNENSYKYSALNLCPLHTLGSIEFRFMKSTTDTERVEGWIKFFRNVTEVFKRTDLRSIQGRFYKNHSVDILLDLLNVESKEFILEGRTITQAKKEINQYPQENRLNIFLIQEQRRFLKQINVPPRVYICTEYQADQGYLDSDYSRAIYGALPDAMHIEIPIGEDEDLDEF